MVDNNHLKQWCRFVLEIEHIEAKKKIIQEWRREEVSFQLSPEKIKKKLFGGVGPYMQAMTTKI